MIDENVEICIIYCEKYYFTIINDGEVYEKLYKKSSSI